CARYQSGFDYW
nr:immunoglobulin heavy chain junction region [Macaca mulatta]